jgi:predicted RNase H-like HicB family nuclease
MAEEAIELYLECLQDDGEEPRIGTEEMVSNTLLPVTAAR